MWTKFDFYCFWHKSWKNGQNCIQNFNKEMDLLKAVVHILASWNGLRCHGATVYLILQQHCSLDCIEPAWIWPHTWHINKCICLWIAQSILDCADWICLFIIWSPSICWMCIIEDGSTERARTYGLRMPLQGGLTVGHLMLWWCKHSTSTNQIMTAFPLQRL